MKVCRFCKNYKPDKRFQGVIGICANDSEAVDVTNTCNVFTEGEQVWLDGEPVK